MAPRSGEKGTFLGYVGGDIPCYSCNLRGNGILDPNSNWRLWNADMKVFRDATTDDAEEVFASKDEEVRAKKDRLRKALMWVTVSEKLRGEHLVDLGGRDKSSNDVFRRLFERVAPLGTPYEPPPPLLKKDAEDAKRAGEIKERDS